MGPRLSLAFALVTLGRRELSEFSPLQYLVNTLNSRIYRDSAEPLLLEVARDPETRAALYCRPCRIPKRQRGKDSTRPDPGAGRR